MHFRVSIFDAIMGQLESTFTLRVADSLRYQWASLKLYELDQIPPDTTFITQQLSFEEYMEAVCGLCVSCKGEDNLESFIGGLVNRLISTK